MEPHFCDGTLEWRWFRYALDEVKSGIVCAKCGKIFPLFETGADACSQMSTPHTHTRHALESGGGAVLRRVNYPADAPLLERKRVRENDLSNEPSPTHSHCWPQ